MREDQEADQMYILCSKLLSLPPRPPLLPFSLTP